MTDIDTTEHSQQGLDRIVFFSDAVVAIAITLLVLPLVDTARDVPDGAAVFFRENGFAVAAAGISFAVISGFWRDHHELFTHVTGYNATVMRWNLLWLAGIVVLPLVTVLEVAAPHGDRLSVGLYLGVITVTMAVSRLLATSVRRAGLVTDIDTYTRWRVRSQWVPVLMFVAASVVAIVFPGIGLWVLLAMLGAPFLSRAVARRGES